MSSLPDDDNMAPEPDDGLSLLEDRLSDLEARIRALESDAEPQRETPAVARAATDPWEGPPPSLNRPERSPALQAPWLLPWTPNLDADRDVLTATQGTQDADEYDAQTSANGVDVQFITDIKYDTTAHTLTYRTRTLKLPPGVSIVTAEGDAVTVTTAAECP